MKAEQRKELETNTLADKMGRVVQRVKESQRRTFTGYIITAVVVLVALFLGYRWWATRQLNLSTQWVAIYEGGQAQLLPLIEQDPDTAAGKAARFQAAYLLYWDKGIKKLGLDAKDAVRNIRQAGQAYEELATACKDDQIFEPQAMLGKAVVEETRAVQTGDALDKAKGLYEEVFKKYEKSVQGQFAQQRFDELNDAKKQKIVSRDYEELARLLDPTGRVLRQDANKAPPPMDPFFLDKLKKPE